MCFFTRVKPPNVLIFQLHAPTRSSLMQETGMYNLARESAKLPSIMNTHSVDCEEIAELITNLRSRITIGGNSIVY